MASLQEWKRAGLFVPYWRCGWSEESDQGAFDAVATWVEQIEHHINVDGKGLLLVGQPGRGKTLLAHIAADGVLDSAGKFPGVRPRDLLMGITVQGYLALHHKSMELMDLVRKTSSEEASQQYLARQETIDALLNRVKVLLLDDLGKEHATSTGYSQNQISRLIRARGNKGLPTIITTNLTVKAIADHYGASFASYLRQVCNTVFVLGDDHRIRETRETA